MRLALLATLLLTGCTSTRYLDATSRADIADAQAAVVGQTADVMLVSGDRYRGEVQSLRLDSTVWAETGAAHAVPTADVLSLVLDTRRRSMARGAFIGGSITVGLCYLGATSYGDDGETVRCVLGGMGVGLVIGALAGRRTTLVFQGTAARQIGDAAAGPSE